MRGDFGRRTERLEDRVSYVRRLQAALALSVCYASGAKASAPITTLLEEVVVVCDPGDTHDGVYHSLDEHSHVVPGGPISRRSDVDAGRLLYALVQLVNLRLVVHDCNVPTRGALGSERERPRGIVDRDHLRERPVSVAREEAANGALVPP